MNLILTGGTGFLGAQIVTHWLRAHPEARVLCLVRADDDAAARKRLELALRFALADMGPNAAADNILGRADAIVGDLDDSASVLRAVAGTEAPTEIVHCAANLSFREGERDAIWRTNVAGTTALLDTPMPVAAFNYVSTAYVAGDREGDILEDETAAPGRFNNAYEESKWTAEREVRTVCERRGVAWRVFRPSIVIAHSVTHRMASQSGFYNVVDVLLRLGREHGGRARDRIVLPVAKDTTLDLVPVDAVARELTAIIEAGPLTFNRTFHLTSPNPLPLDQVLAELSPLSGVAIGVRGAPEGDAGADPAARALVNRLRHYMPYFGLARRFDRRNVDRVLDADRFRLDVESLGRFVRSFVARQGEARGETDAQFRLPARPGNARGPSAGPTFRQSA